jgi:hypothetical protein
VKLYQDIFVTWKYMQLRGRSSVKNKLGTKSSYLPRQYFNSVKLAETLLDKKTRVCGTMRVNRGTAHDLEKEAKNLKKY